MGISWDYNSPRELRKVECPECANVINSRHRYCQCTNTVCRFRFDGDIQIYKTPDDRFKERQEIFSELDKMKTRFVSLDGVIQNEIKSIELMQQKLKPLDKPKLKESLSKPIPQVTEHLIQ